MNKNIGIGQGAEEKKRVQLNTSKLEAVLCIALSAIISLAIIGWLLH